MNMRGKLLRRASSRDTRTIRFDIGPIPRRVVLSPFSFRRVAKDLKKSGKGRGVLTLDRLSQFSGEMYSTP
jgi:hypothetical protein